MSDDGKGRGRRGSDNPFGQRGTNGSRPEGMVIHGSPLADLGDPVDLVAVQADDELINALAAGMSVSAPGFGGYDADDHVAAILAAWKADVDATPIPELCDVEMAAATIAAATRPRIGRMRHLAPVAAAAAVVVLAIGGLSVGSYNSRPGDALWGVSKVFYSERAKSVEAAARVESSIDSAKRALLSGQPEVAAQELQQAGADLAAVRPEDGKADLGEVTTFLAAKADETPPGEPAVLSAPLKRDASAKVPPKAAEMPPPPPSDPATSDPGSTTKPTPSRPGGSTGSTGGGTGPSADPRARVAPETAASATPTATPTPVPSTKPTTEGGPSGSTSPTATPEGGPSSTTPHSMGPGGDGGRTTTAGAATSPR